MNTIEILKTHNAWRRGDDTRSMDELGFSVTELGIAIDDAVRAIQERDQLRAELEECIRAWALATSELAQERGRVRELVEAFECLIDNSDGVTGLHLNGDVAPWESLLEGGEFEAWLLAYSDVINALTDQGEGATQ